VAGILTANGVATFAQLAEASAEQLHEILEAEGLKFMKPDTWPEQAEFAASEDWIGLQNLHGQLKGGRRIEN
jgi:predicted flap endonuclease-1-like 5' DNA nuclease